MKPLSFLAQYYYSEGIMVVTGITALIICIMNYRRQREIRIFCFYILFSLTQIATDFYHYMEPGERLPIKIEALTTLSFLLFENIVCIGFVYSKLVSRKRKLAIVGLPIFFVIGFLLMLKFKTMVTVFQFFLLDCISLTIPCFLYFYELFLYPSDRPLKNQPVFWVITGILFLNCMSIPLYLSNGLTVHDSYKAFSLNFLLYALFYSLIARAFLCRPAAVVNPGEAMVPVGLRGRSTIEPIN